MARLAAFLILLCSVCHAQEPRTNRVLFFTADYCQPCKDALSGTNQFVQWLRDAGWKIGVEDWNHIQVIDIEQRTDLAEVYGVEFTPAMVRLGGNEKPVAYLNRQSLVNLLPKEAKRKSQSYPVSSYAVLIRLGSTGRASGINTPYGVLTCHHVAIAGSPIQVTCNGETATATILRIDQKNDLALLKVQWNGDHPKAEIGIIPSVSQTVVSVGMANDGTISVDEQEVVESSALLLKTSHASNSGRSGGGIFDSDGNLVGIVGGSVTQSVPFIGYARGVGPIKDLIIPRVAAVRKGSGQHVHVCPKCHYAWQHGSEAAGDPFAHRCPRCHHWQFVIDHFVN